MARKAGRILGETAEESRVRSEAARPSSGPRPDPVEEVWIFEGEVEVGSAARRPGTPAAPLARRGGDEAALPSDVVNEIAGAVGRDRAPRIAERLGAAAGAYARDRYEDAFRITRRLADLVPESSAVRELHGLTCYRLGRWRDAVRHLTAAADLAGEDMSQVPVLMDCHRAQGHHRKVAELWDVLRQSSPGADVLVEGRLVLASTLAERGDLTGAIALLTEAGAARDLRRPADRHLRQWYLLADLSERAGDVPRARVLFERVADADPGLADAAQRLGALGKPARSRVVGRRSDTTLGDLARAARSSGRSPGRR